MPATTATTVAAPTEMAPRLSAIARLRQLEWRVRHAVENVLSGEYRSAIRGSGMEFDQVVKYEYGDEVRSIDWNVTARLGETYRKKFIEEREVTVLVVFEDTPSLQFGSGADSRREALLELAGLVMLLGAVNRDRVGFVHATPAGYTLSKPVRGRGRILHAAAILMGSAPPPLDATAPATGDQGSCIVPLPMLSRAAPRHSVLIWLGDFPPRDKPDGWSVLSRRYQTMGFRVDDPWDRGLPAGEAFVTYDPVAERLVTLEGSAPERAAHAEWRGRREQAWREMFPAPLSRLVAGTDEDRLDALIRFFHARERAHVH